MPLLEDTSAPGGVDPAGADAYGVTALHKFASWNKTAMLDLLLPALPEGAINAACPEGKTALHWAVEMASVGAVKVLVRAGIDADAKNAKGQTVRDVLAAAEPSGIIERLQKALEPKTETEAETGAEAKDET